jgi:hypothetical protein
MRYGEPSPGAGREAVPLPQPIAARWFVRQWPDAASLSSIRAVTGGQGEQSLPVLRSASSPALQRSLLQGHLHVLAIAGTIRMPLERPVSGTSARGEKTTTRHIAKPDEPKPDLHLGTGHKMTMPVTSLFACSWRARLKRSSPSASARRNPETPAASAVRGPVQCRWR